MGLADLPVEPPPLRKGPLCSVAVILRKLPPDDAEWLNRRMADPEWRNSDIARALKAEGFEVQGQTIARHRAGECKCSR